MASFTGTKVKDTYPAILKVSDNGALDGTLQTITDGVGNNSALSLSTAGASVGGTLAVSGAATFSGALNGTISTAAQPNITSVGTLSSLGVAANSNTATFNRTASSGATVSVQVVGSTIGTLGSDTGGGGIFDISSVAGGASGDTVQISRNGGTPTARFYNTGDISFRDSSANEAFYWDASAASLGIGTPTPSEKIDVIGGAIAAGNGTIRTGITYSSLGLMGTFTNHDLGIITNGTERMRIDSSGNVGIGTSSPLTTSSSFGLTIGSGIQNQPFLNLNRNRLGGYFAGVRIYNESSVSSYMQEDGDGNLRFGTANTERMRITSGGDVLVGTTATDPIASSSNGWSFSGSDKILRGYQSDVPMIALSRGTNGQVVIFNSGLTTVGNISITGSATSYNTSSDYRLKEDWVAMEGALDRVDALKPINFAWKADGSRVDGFLAHELQEVVPEAVTGEKDAVELKQVEVSPAVLDEEGNVITEAVYEEQEVPVYQGIDQSKIVPLLVAAIQELRAELNALKQA